MGKSGGRKKKSSANHATTDVSHDPAANSTAASAAVPSSSNGDADPPIFLKRAQEHKEEGNRFFQSRDYPGALRLYEQALRLLPASHPDRAVFHSNYAANSCSPTTRSPTDFGRRIRPPRRRRRTSHRFRSPPRFHPCLLSFVRGFAHGFIAPGFRPQLPRIRGFVRSFSLHRPWFHPRNSPSHVSGFLRIRGFAREFHPHPRFRPQNSSLRLRFSPYRSSVISSWPQ